MTGRDRQAAMDLLLDEAEIRRVLYRYVRGIDRADFELVRSCYHPDGVDHHGTFTGTRDEFVEFVIGDVGTHTFTTHHLTNISIEVCGDQALVESYALTANGGEPMTDARRNWVGGFRYIDRFERRDGEWLIAERHIVSDWMERWAPHRDRVARFGAVGTMGPDDPLYDVGSRVPGSARHSGETPSPST
jgi:hypothetical protein